jgi:hypothetical protein
VLVQGDGAGMDWSAAQVSHRPPSGRLCARRMSWPADAMACLDVHFEW